MKRAIRYLRFSDPRQSNGSIERQEMYTDDYIARNGIELIDTFIDRGHSARTFDRPDFLKLKEFISKYHKKVEYLLVDQLDRFSRDAGEALTMVKKLQREYGIQIVSVTEGIEFDYDTPGSYFRTALQLVLAEEDNINRSIKVRGGIYTAQAKEGRYIYSKAPFGYIKQGERKNKRLVVHEEEAKVVRFIFDSYLRNVPIYKIKEAVKDMGFNRTGNSSIVRILTHAVYVGKIKVLAFKSYPGGLFDGIHEPIIDLATWYLVQSKIKKVDKVRTIVDDNMPLRGTLKCHCGCLLTGAPSRGRLGGLFYYYKCKHSKHNNISVKKSNTQFLEVCKLMSVPKEKIKEIRDGSHASLENIRATNAKQVIQTKKELEQIEEKLYNVEEKWINSEISKETYDRWYTNYTESANSLKGTILRLSSDQSEVFGILNKNLDMLSDMEYVYKNAPTMYKRTFVEMVFDNNLYYKDGIYRTPTMLKIFSSNHLIMREKNLLYLEETGVDFDPLPLSGAEGS